MNNVEKILLRRKSIITIDEEKYNNDKFENGNYALTVMKNLESLGYTFTKETFENLSHCSLEYIKDFYFDLVTNLKELVYGNVEFIPMYPNFPNQVIEMQDCELFIDAFIHGFTLKLQEYEKEERFPLVRNYENMRKLSFYFKDSVGYMKEAKKLRDNLIGSKKSLSKQDKDDLVELVNYFYYCLPETIEYKENMCLICKIIYDKTRELPKQYIKTSTDLLRVLTQLSDGDTSLKDNCNFKHFNNKMKRTIMEILEELSKSKNFEEDMKRYKYRWIRVGEIVHPFKKQFKKYKNTRLVFDKLRNGKKIETFNGKLVEMKNNGYFVEYINMLKTRPTEFARQLNVMIKDFGMTDLVLNIFEEIIENVSTPVLIDLKEYFSHRTEENEYRTFFPKGNVAIAYTIDNNLAPLSENICTRIMVDCASELCARFSTKDPIGKVYIDEDMGNYIIPFSQRNASSSMKMLTRGSRFKINENCKILRPFIWWTNPKNDWRTDIDLSATFVDKDFKYVSHISYTYVSNKELNCCHSGDIQDGGDYNGKGVAEFIDLDINKLRENKVRYILFQVYNYTNIPYSEMDHCMFGWMERDNNTGEIFEPSTVKQKINLSSNSETSLPMIFDCETNEIIWCDMSLSICNYNELNNVEDKFNKVKMTCLSVLNMKKENMYDLIELNALSRGEIVYDINEADVIFSDKDVDLNILNNLRRKNKTEKELEEIKDVVLYTPYDTEIYISELM